MFGLCYQIHQECKWTAFLAQRPGKQGCCGNNGDIKRSILGSPDGTQCMYLARHNKSVGLGTSSGAQELYD